MRIIIGDRGDWFMVEYTIGNDPIVLNAKLKLKVESGNIEGQIMSLLAARHECELGSVWICGHVVRCVQ